MTVEAMKQAIEAIENRMPYDAVQYLREAIEAQEKQEQDESRCPTCGEDGGTSCGAPDCGLLLAKTEAEPVAWQYRWTNPGQNPNVSQEETAWKEVDAYARKGRSLEATISDLRAHRFNGRFCYEVRALYTHPQSAPPNKLWLWKNFVDGRPEYWAFDNPFPGHLDNGDPQTLGEPCGYALFKESRTGRTDVTEEQVLLRIEAAAAPKAQRDELREKVQALTAERDALDGTVRLLSKVQTKLIAERDAFKKDVEMSEHYRSISEKERDALRNVIEQCLDDFGADGNSVCPATKQLVIDAARKEQT